MAQAYDRIFKPRSFREGDLVFEKILPFREHPRGKFKPNFEGPYIVTKVFPKGALYLFEIDGDSLPKLVNYDSIKRYFVYVPYFTHCLK